MLLYTQAGMDGWKSLLALGMAMRMRQMQNDADNARICANVREYVQIYADMRIGKIWRMAIPSEYLF